MYSHDHKEFTRLREKLSKDGYIKIERSWINGDRVTKSFKLNNKIFRKGEKFLCAEAMRYVLERKT